MKNYWKSLDDFLVFPSEWQIDTTGIYGPLCTYLPTNVEIV